MAENVESAQDAEAPDVIALQPQRGTEIGQPQLTKQSSVSTQSRKKSKKLTCSRSCCIKATVRFIKLAISMWQIADMVSDGLNTIKYLHYAEV